MSGFVGFGEEISMRSDLGVFPLGGLTFSLRRWVGVLFGIVIRPGGLVKIHKGRLKFQKGLELKT